MYAIDMDHRYIIFLKIYLKFGKNRNVLNSLA
jgi:hypothetical protein